MERRIYLFFLGVVFGIALLLTSAVVAWDTMAQVDRNAAVAEDVRALLSEDERPDLVWFEPTKEDAAYDAIAREKNGTTLVVKPPREGFFERFLHVLPITVVVVGFFVVIATWVSRHITKSTLDPVVSSLEEIRGIVSGRKPAGTATPVPELASVVRDMEYEKAQIDYSMTKLIESEKMRRDFTANVSHELKTPLTSINGYAEMIESGLATEEDAQRFAGIIRTEGNRLLDLIDDTIRLSLLEHQNPAELLTDTIDLQELATQIAEKLRIAADKRRLELTVEGETAVMMGNRRMMEDAVTNLISNAIKYNREEGSVRVQTWIDNDRCYLSVSDTGIGISEEDRVRVFERFYMGSKARAGGNGTGLGLSIVKHVVKLHGGEVELASTLGEGTRIRLSFRRKRGM